MKAKILVVDDDSDIVHMLTDRLQALGYEPLSAPNGQRALEIIELDSPSLVLLDLEMPRMTGMEVLKCLGSGQEGQQETGNKVSVIERDVPVIVMTAYGTIAKAVEAMKAGAHDFLTKPLNADHLAIVIKKALEREALTRQVAFLRSEVEAKYGTIVGGSPAVKSMIDLAKRAADSDATVLLLGESGTGKELFARSIHQWSGRRSMPFIVINCVALQDTLLENELFGHEKGAFTGANSLQKGKIEVAEGGTVFLDEIGDMSQGLQAKLLRLLQDHEFHRVGGNRFVRVNIRVIAATNRDLKQAVKSGAFREDLYFRLNVVSLSIPPLRERQEDIEPLAEFFLTRHLAEMKKPPMYFTPETINAMNRYSWPGNIRELENAIARAVVLGSGKAIEPDQMALTMDEAEQIPTYQGLSYHEAIEQFSRDMLEQTLRKANWSQTKAAELLQLQRTYLARLLKQKNIQDPSHEGLRD